MERKLKSCPFPITKLHTTIRGVTRIKRNLCLDVEDVISWCIQQLQQEPYTLYRKGKNYYVTFETYVLTINASNYSVITAHKT